ncbi:DUF2992 family protein [Lactobacillaceae bacterium 24-114]
MMVIRSCLTISFDNSFYKAALEAHNGKNYSIASVILDSSEPKIALILKLVNSDYQRFHFHHVTDKTQRIIKHVNRKRAQRLANKVIKHQGISTKAQNTLQKQFEEKITKDQTLY